MAASRRVTQGPTSTTQSQEGRPILSRIHQTEHVTALPPLGAGVPRKHEPQEVGIPGDQLGVCPPQHPCGKSPEIRTFCSALGCTVWCVFGGIIWGVSGFTRVTTSQGRVPSPQWPLCTPFQFILHSAQWVFRNLDFFNFRTSLTIFELNVAPPPSVPLEFLTPWRQDSRAQLHPSARGGPFPTLAVSIPPCGSCTLILKNYHLLFTAYSSH